MKIGTLNIRGISTERKQNFLRDFIIQNTLDILCLQEVNVLQMEPKNSKFHVFTNANDKRGAAIIFQKTLNLKATHKSPEGRIIRPEFDNFVIVNFYAFPHNYNAQELLQRHAAPILQGVQHLERFVLKTVTTIRYLGNKNVQ
jgi:exonuclease III